LRLKIKKMDKRKINRRVGGASGLLMEEGMRRPLPKRVAKIGDPQGGRR
jgi:hypothetical protein